jgi:hypothetical protein
LLADLGWCLGLLGSVLLVTAQWELADYCQRAWTTRSSQSIIFDPAKPESGHIRMPVTKGPKAKKLKQHQRREDGVDEECLEQCVVHRVATKDEDEEQDFCVDCGKTVTALQQGLQCDSCGFWHHAKCEKISDEIYCFLQQHTDEPTILWYCRKCVVTSKKMMSAMGEMHEHQRQIEERMDEMAKNVNGKLADLASELGRKLGGLEKSMSSKIEEKVSKIEEFVENHKMDNNEIKECVQGVGKISKQLDEQRADKMQIRGCIQEAVQVTLKEDKEEEEEQLKHSTSVIIHGLSESKEEDSGKRMEEDADRIMAMAVEIKAEDK